MPSRAVHPGSAPAPRQELGEGSFVPSPRPEESSVLLVVQRPEDHLPLVTGSNCSPPATTLTFRSPAQLIFLLGEPEPFPGLVENVQAPPPPDGAEKNARPPLAQW